MSRRHAAEDDLRIDLYLNEHLAGAVRKEAARTGLSLSDVIRQGVRLAYLGPKRKVPKDVVHQKATMKCESPSEHKLLGALLTKFDPELADGPVLGKYQGLSLYQQYRVGKYRLDFAVLGPTLKLAIEVDGHDHRTQTEYDKKRDEWLVATGWEVLRLTNQEVAGDGSRCVARVTALMEVLSPAQGVVAGLSEADIDAILADN
jgi:very-short-patch-repair endonuclease